MRQQLQATLRIREMILRGDLAPGQRVPEAVVARQLGISRTPVRQALPALAEEGLLIPAGRAAVTRSASSPSPKSSPRSISARRSKDWRRGY
jgi:DNA-binding GntR family transcriptional regulator